MIRLQWEGGKAIVEWRGWPMLIPIRHVRPFPGAAVTSVVRYAGSTSIFAAAADDKEKVDIANNLST